jgi:hypothetical protein
MYSGLKGKVHNMDKKKEIINLENAIGSIALGNYLSDWNSDKSYDEIQEILQGLENCYDSDPDEISVWGKFEQDAPSEVAEHISNLHGDVKDLLVDVLTEIKTGVITLDEVLKKLKGI